MRTVATAGQDGIIFRTFAGTCPIPIVTLPIASTADEAVCGRLNFLPISGTSGRRVLLGASTVFLATLVRIGQADQAAQVDPVD